MNNTKKIMVLSLVSATAMVFATGCQSVKVSSQQNSVSKTSAQKQAYTPSQKRSMGTSVVMQRPEVCEDFMKWLDNKPIEMEFVGCNASFYSNNYKLIANYRVKGKNVLSVQEQLHKLSGMPRLVKDCCQWSSLDVETEKNHGSLSIRGKKYLVSMHGGELRLGWNIAADIEHIPYFYVQVARSLEHAPTGKLSK